MRLLSQPAVYAVFSVIQLHADMVDTHADLNALPTVPAGFHVSLFAKEPLVQQPCSIAFDTRGRLFIGMGPQYRNPTGCDTDYLRAWSVKLNLTDMLTRVLP